MFGPTGLGVLILINRQLVFREALSRLFVRQRANALGAKIDRQNQRGFTG
jgi:hypothetical protein